MRGNANDGAYITNAEYDLFEGENVDLTGDALFGLAHRYTMGQVAANWSEAHPNEQKLNSYTLSNRLQNFKERMAKEPGGRSKRELTQECQDAGELVGIKSNGKVTQQVDIPWPPRRPAPANGPAPVIPPAPPAIIPPVAGPSSVPGTVGSSGAPTSGGDEGDTQPRDDGAADPASGDSEDEDDDESQSGADAPTTTGEGAEAERGEDKSAPGSTTAEPKGKNKKRPVPGGDEPEGEVEGPRAKRPNTRERAPVQEPSEGDRGTGEASRPGGSTRPAPKHGGALEAVPGDPSTIYTGSEFEGPEDGVKVVSHPKDYVDRAPPHPDLGPEQYAAMGLEGTARESLLNQHKFRTTVLSGTSGPQEVDGEAGTEGVEVDEKSENEDGGQESDAEDGVVEKRGEQDEDENDA